MAAVERQDPVEALPSVHAVLGRPGTPLADAVREPLEQRLGHDFKNVRVHTDARAADSARAVRARAYTVGDRVVFGAGEFRPHTGEGRQLHLIDVSGIVEG